MFSIRALDTALDTEVGQLDNLDFAERGHSVPTTVKFEY